MAKPKVVTDILNLFAQIASIKSGQFITVLTDANTLIDTCRYLIGDPNLLTNRPADTMKYGMLVVENSGGYSTQTYTTYDQSWCRFYNGNQWWAWYSLY